jgi:hypothetical protein
MPRRERTMKPTKSDQFRNRHDLGVRRQVGQQRARPSRATGRRPGRAKRVPRARLPCRSHGFGDRALVLNRALASDAATTANVGQKLS